MDQKFWSWQRETKQVIGLHQSKVTQCHSYEGFLKPRWNDNKRSATGFLSRHVETFSVSANFLSSKDLKKFTAGINVTSIFDFKFPQRTPKHLQHWPAWVLLWNHLLFVFLQSLVQEINMVQAWAFSQYVHIISRQGHRGSVLTAFSDSGLQWHRQLSLTLLIFNKTTLRKHKLH